MISEFRKWMVDKKGIAETSAKKYVSAITAVSSDMIKRRIIAIDLYQCGSAPVLQDEIEKVRRDPYFQEKIGEETICIVLHFTIIRNSFVQNRLRRRVVPGAETGLTLYEMISKNI